jgi:hypothetical protein
VSRQIIKPATFDGSGPWNDYALFEACAELSAWNYNQRGLYLAVSLLRNAQGVLGNMPKGTKPDYHTLVKALTDLNLPVRQSFTGRRCVSDDREQENVFQS